MSSAGVPEAAAAVYVATHSGLGAHRVGVTDSRALTDRLRVNERKGWRIVGLVHVANRREADRVESALLANLRAAGVPPVGTGSEVPHGGHTETLPQTAMSAEELLRVVRRTAGQDEHGPEGRLGAVLDLLGWCRRHLREAAVATAWADAPGDTATALEHVAEAADQVAAQARALLDNSPGLRVNRTLSEIRREMETITVSVQEVLDHASKDELSAAAVQLEQIRALSRRIAEHSDVLARTWGLSLDLDDAPLG